jgi:hypothetical protein
LLRVIRALAAHNSFIKNEVLTMALDIYRFQPDNPAQALIEVLDREQSFLNANRPKGSRISSTAILTTGEQIKIISAYAAGPDLLVFTAIREKKTVKVVTRYGMIAQVVFHFEKGEPREISFESQPPPVGFHPES